MNTEDDLIQLSSEQLRELAAGRPVAVLLGEQSFSLTPPAKPKGAAFASLGDLSAAVMAPRTLTMEVQPTVFAEFRIQALDADVAKECDDIGRDVVPPKKQKAGPRGVVSDEVDFDDPAFIVARGLVNQRRTTFVLLKGLVGFDIPGENLEEKNKALRKALPPRVINALYAAITGLTSDPIEVADFS